MIFDKVSDLSLISDDAMISKLSSIEQYNNAVQTITFSLNKRHSSEKKICFRKIVQLVKKALENPEISASEKISLHAKFQMLVEQRKTLKNETHEIIKIYNSFLNLVYGMNKSLTDIEYAKFPLLNELYEVNRSKSSFKPELASCRSSKILAKNLLFNRLPLKERTKLNHLCSQSEHKKITEDLFYKVALMSKDQIDSLASSIVQIFNLNQKNQHLFEFVDQVALAAIDAFIEVSEENRTTLLDSICAIKQIIDSTLASLSLELASSGSLEHPLNDDLYRALNYIKNGLATQFLIDLFIQLKTIHHTKRNSLLKYAETLVIDIIFPKSSQYPCVRLLHEGLIPFFLFNVLLSNPSHQADHLIESIRQISEWIEKPHYSNKFIKIILKTLCYTQVEERLNYFQKEEIDSLHFKLSKITCLYGIENQEDKKDTILAAFCLIPKSKQNSFLKNYLKISQHPNKINQIAELLKFGLSFNPDQLLNYFNCLTRFSETQKEACLSGRFHLLLNHLPVSQKPQFIKSCIKTRFLCETSEGRLFFRVLLKLFSPHPQNPQFDFLRSCERLFLRYKMTSFINKSNSREHAIDTILKALKLTKGKSRKYLVLKTLQKCSKERREEICGFFSLLIDEKKELLTLDGKEISSWHIAQMIKIFPLTAPKKFQLPASMVYHHLLVLIEANSWKGTFSSNTAIQDNKHSLKLTENEMKTFWSQLILDATSIKKCTTEVTKDLQLAGHESYKIVKDIISVLKEIPTDKRDPLVSSTYKLKGGSQTLEILHCIKGKHRQLFEEAILSLSQPWQHMTRINRMLFIDNLSLKLAEIPQKKIKQVVKSTNELLSHQTPQHYQKHLLDSIKTISKISHKKRAAFISQAHAYGPSAHAPYIFYYFEGYSWEKFYLATSLIAGIQERWGLNHSLCIGELLKAFRDLPVNLLTPYIHTANDFLNNLIDSICEADFVQLSLDQPALIKFSSLVIGLEFSMAIYQRLYETIVLIDPSRRKNYISLFTGQVNAHPDISLTDKDLPLFENLLLTAFKDNLVATNSYDYLLACLNSNELSDDIKQMIDQRISTHLLPLKIGGEMESLFSSLRINRG